MYILELALVSKQFKAGTVSFRSTNLVEQGTLVECTINRRKAFAVVTRCIHAREARMFAKSALFELKEITIHNQKQLFNQKQVELLFELSKQLGTTVEKMLYELVTKAEMFSKIPVFTGMMDISGNLENARHSRESENPVLVVEADTLSRFEKYSTQNFFGSTCIIMPTKALAKSFSKKFPDWKYLTDSFITKNFTNESIPQKVVCTLEYALLATFFETIVLDSCTSQNYHTHTSPFIPRSSVWTKLWQNSGKHIVLGDSLLPAGFESQIEQITPINTDFGKRELVIISPDEATPTTYLFLKYFFNQFLLDNKNQETYKKILIWHERVGIGRSTFCPSCGYQEVCSNCAGSLKLEQEEGSALNILRCTSCKNTFETRDVCAKCDGALLVQIPGIETLKKFVEERPKLYSNFELVFTTSKDLVMHTLENFDLIVVPLLGSQLNNPSHNATEKTLRSLLSFSPSIPILVNEELKKELENGNWKKFWDQDLHIRKQAKLPPWGNLIEGTLLTSHKKAQDALPLLATFCKKEELKIIKTTEKMRISFKVLYENEVDYSETLYELSKLGIFEYTLFPKTKEEGLPFF